MVSIFTMSEGFYRETKARKERPICLGFLSILRKNGVEPTAQTLIEGIPTTEALSVVVLGGIHNVESSRQIGPLGQMESIAVAAVGRLTSYAINVYQNNQ